MMESIGGHGRWRLEIDTLELTCNWWSPWEAMGGGDEKWTRLSWLAVGGVHRRPWEVEIRDGYA